jgi:hypothetical protein
VQAPTETQCKGNVADGSKATNPPRAKLPRCPLLSESGQKLAKLICPLSAISRHSFTRRVSLELSFFELNHAETMALLEPSLAHAFEEFWHLVGRIGDVLLDPRDRDIQLQFP